MPAAERDWGATHLVTASMSDCVEDNCEREYKVSQSTPKRIQHRGATYCRVGC